MRSVKLQFIVWASLLAVGLSYFIVIGLVRR
jgi:hypothetical protein